MMLDLDGLKAVNDQQGHERGNALLRGYGQARAGLFRQSDQVYRLGGDQSPSCCPALRKTPLSCWHGWSRPRSHYTPRGFLVWGPVPGWRSIRGTGWTRRRWCVSPTSACMTANGNTRRRRRCRSGKPDCPECGVKIEGGAKHPGGAQFCCAFCGYRAFRRRGRQAGEWTVRAPARADAAVPLPARLERQPSSAFLLSPTPLRQHKQQCLKHTQARRIHPGGLRGIVGPCQLPNHTVERASRQVAPGAGGSGPFWICQQGRTVRHGGLFGPESGAG